MFNDIDEDMQAINMANSHGKREINKEELLNNCRKNSLRSEGAQKYRYSESREKTKKSRFKKIISLLIALSVIAGSYNFVYQPIKREKALADANDYMSTKIVSYLDTAGIDYSILSHKSIFIDDNLDKISTLYNIMEQDGFVRDEIYYAISKVCGEQAFDKVVQVNGYKNSKDYLMNNYFENQVNDQGVVVARYISPKRFENNVQEGYVKNVERIQDNAKKRINEDGKLIENTENEYVDVDAIEKGMIL